MNAETKRLAIVATICFFPTAIVGWLFYNKHPKQALTFFRLSITLFLIAILITGILVVINGGRWITPMGSFF